MSNQKIVHIALITKNAEILLTDPLQEQAAYAIQDLCREKEWGNFSITIGTQYAHAELALPKDFPNGIAMRDLKKAIATRLFENDPDLKSRQKRQLWEHDSVIAQNPEGETVAPKGLSNRIQQAIRMASPGASPSLH